MAYDIALKYRPEYLRDLAFEELGIMLDQAHKAHFELRSQSSQGGRVKFPAFPDLFKKVKKDIARIKTIIGEAKCQSQKHS